MLWKEKKPKEGKEGKGKERKGKARQGKARQEREGKEREKKWEGRGGGGREGWRRGRSGREVLRKEGHCICQTQPGEVNLFSLSDIHSVLLGTGKLFNSK